MHHGFTVSRLHGFTAFETSLFTFTPFYDKIKIYAQRHITIIYIYKRGKTGGFA